MTGIPKDWLDSADIERIIVHWTAGKYVPNYIDIQHYHYLVGKGEVHRGIYTPNDNIDTSDNYAAHTRGLNTRSIGIAFCAMMGAKPAEPGRFAITNAQVDDMIKCLVDLCYHYDLDPMNRRHLLGHSEVEEVYGVKQANKWDVDWLPSLGYYRVGCMQYIRDEVSYRLKAKTIAEQSIMARDAGEEMVGVECKKTEEEINLKKTNLKKNNLKKGESSWIKLCRLFSSLLKIIRKS